MDADYSIITELPDTKIPVEQLERFYQRYKFAQSFSANKRVLEIACGGGQGLNLFKNNARQITGVDIDKKNLDVAKKTYKTDSKITVEFHDANDLQFAEKSFDLIIIFEAIYYLENTDKILKICKRILSDEGILIIESANKEWKDFNPSPFASKYFCAEELYTMLLEAGFKPEIYCSYKIGDNKSINTTILSYIKRIAIQLHLIPRSMKYKKYLKKIFLGKQILLPAKLTDGMCDYVEPEKISPQNYDPQFKVIFALGYNV